LIDRGLRPLLERVRRLGQRVRSRAEKADQSVAGHRRGRGVLAIHPRKRPHPRLRRAGKSYQPEQQGQQGCHAAGHATHTPSTSTSDVGLSVTGSALPPVAVVFSFSNSWGVADKSTRILSTWPSTSRITNSLNPAAPLEADRFANARS